MPQKLVLRRTLRWKTRVMTGERSMKSTLSSASQWKDFRNSSSTNRATNLGEKSSLETQRKALEYNRQRLFFFSVSVLRIQSVHPGSQIRIFPCRIPDPVSKRHRIPDPDQQKEFRTFNPKICYQALGNPGCLFRIPEPESGFFPSWIQGSKFQRFPDSDPQHCSVFIASFGLFLCSFLVTASFGGPTNFTVSEVEPSCRRIYNNEGQLKLLSANQKTTVPYLTSPKKLQYPTYFHRLFPSWNYTECSRKICLFFSLNNWARIKELQN